MAKSGHEAIKKLARFRRLAEDKAAAELRAACGAAREAESELDDIQRDRDAITREKASLNADGFLSLDRYASCLELEVNVSKRVVYAETELRKAEAGRGLSQARYRVALDAVRIVEKRGDRRAKEALIRAERSDTDLVAELWLGRRAHDNA